MDDYWEQQLELILEELENEQKIKLNIPNPSELPFPHLLLNCNYHSPQNDNNLIDKPCNNCYQCKLKNLYIVMFISNNDSSNKILKDLINKDLLIGMYDITFSKSYLGFDNKLYHIDNYPFFYSIKTHKYTSNVNTSEDIYKELEEDYN